MSNDMDDERRPRTRRKWALVLGGLLVGLFFIYGLYSYLYPDCRLCMNSEFPYLPFPIPRPEDEDGVNDSRNENRNEVGAAEGLSSPETGETVEPAGLEDLDLTVTPGDETDGTDSESGSASGSPDSTGPETFIEPPEPGEPAPPPTPAQVAEVTCTGPPSGWIEYTIQTGDTLTALALTSGSSVTELQRANCLADERLIAGALFYLPQIPPSPTAVRAPATAVPTATSTSETAVAELIPTAVTFPPTPVPITSPPLPEESTSLLSFLWIVMLALLIGALVWIWRQRRRA